ncbi:MAG: SAM-dependent methyltransferase [Verrucomicrobiota bacterium]
MEFPEPVSHETFMQRALYDPEEGYYTTRASVGKSGDFSTSATLSPAFAQAISNWAKAHAKRLGLPICCPLIELGPGNGALAKELSLQLPDWPLHLVEKSEPLRRIQSEQLEGRNFQHYTDLQSALEETKGFGLIVANEFIDAFPAVKLRWIENDWREVGVHYENGLPREILAPLERSIDADAPAHPKEGETIYVHPSFHSWMKGNIPAFKQGALLFIDYGAERPARECRAYAGQQRYEGIDVYDEPGARDITCDVNFTDLIRWCQQLGLNIQEVTNQADFLKSQLNDFEAHQKSDEAFRFLAAASGAGGAFKVLSAETR